jgi:hypothetical protein
VGHGRMRGLVLCVKTQREWMIRPGVEILGLFVGKPSSDVLPRLSQAYQADQ